MLHYLLVYVITLIIHTLIGRRRALRRFLGINITGGSELGGDHVKPAFEMEGLYSEQLYNLNETVQSLNSALEPLAEKTRPSWHQTRQT